MRPTIDRIFPRITWREPALKWLPLRSDEFYRDNGSRLALGCGLKLDARQKNLTLHGGRELRSTACCLATGAAPVRLQIAGAEPDACAIAMFCSARSLPALLPTRKAS